MSLTDTELYDEGVTKLKEIAKAEGVTGYSKYRSNNKRELVEIIIEHRKQRQNRIARTSPSPRKIDGFKLLKKKCSYYTIAELKQIAVDNNLQIAGKVTKKSICNAYEKKKAEVTLPTPTQHPTQQSPTQHPTQPPTVDRSKPVLSKKCMNYLKHELQDLAIKHKLSSSGTKQELCNRILMIYDEPESCVQLSGRRKLQCHDRKMKNQQIRVELDTKDKPKDKPKKYKLSKELIKNSDYRKLTSLVSRQDVIEFAKLHGFADQINLPTDEILQNMWMIFNDESFSDESPAESIGNEPAVKTPVKPSPIIHSPVKPKIPSPIIPSPVKPKIPSPKIPSPKIPSPKIPSPVKPKIPSPIIPSPVKPKIPSPKIPSPKIPSPVKPKIPSPKIPTHFPKVIDSDGVNSMEPSEDEVLIQKKIDAIERELQISPMSTAMLNKKEEKIQRYKRYLRTIQKARKSIEPRKEPKKTKVSTKEVVRSPSPPIQPPPELLVDPSPQKMRSDTSDDVRDVEKKAVEKAKEIQKERMRKQRLIPPKDKVLDVSTIADIENQLSEITAPVIVPPTSLGEIRNSIFRELGMNF